MLFKEIIAVCSVSDAEPVSTLHKQNEESRSDTYFYHRALKGQRMFLSGAHKYSTYPVRNFHLASFRRFSRSVVKGEHLRAGSSLSVCMSVCLPNLSLLSCVVWRPACSGVTVLQKSKTLIPTVGHIFIRARRRSNIGTQCRAAVTSDRISARMT
jgi:hypothetical protein